MKPDPQAKPNYLTLERLERLLNPRTEFKLSPQAKRYQKRFEKKKGR